MSKPRELNREEQELLSKNPQLFKVNRIGTNSSKAGSKIKWTDEQIEFIKSDYDNNLDVKRLALLFGTSEQTMREWLHKFGIKTLTKTEKNRLLHKRDSDFFEKIDTPEKAYWLGFLYADGGIDKKKNYLRINLQEKDRDHLEKFLIAIKDKNTKIKETIKKVGEKEYKGVYLGIGDKKMVQDLINKGCTPKKSFTITFPTEEQVPENLISHFIRGYFDGDGCITYSKHLNSDLKYYGGNIIGTVNLLKGILEKIGKQNLKISPLSKKEKTAYSVNFSGNKMMANLGRYLYNNSTDLIRLSRKFNKFLELKKQRETKKTYSNKDEYIEE